MNSSHKSLNNIQEYKLAIRITKELPIVLDKLIQFREEINNYRVYRDVANVIDKVDGAIVMLNLELAKYNKVKENKGKSE